MVTDKQFEQLEAKVAELTYKLRRLETAIYSKENIELWKLED